MFFVLNARPSLACLQHRLKAFASVTSTLIVSDDLSLVYESWSVRFPIKTRYFFTALVVPPMSRCGSLIGRKAVTFPLLALGCLYIAHVAEAKVARALLVSLSVEQVDNSQHGISSVLSLSKVAIRNARCTMLVLVTVSMSHEGGSNSPSFFIISLEIRVKVFLGQTSNNNNLPVRGCGL
jgi:hypothetical protein